MEICKMEQLTFEQMPEAVSKLLASVSRIEKILLDYSCAANEEQGLMDVKETSLFLDLSVSTIYTKVCRGEIPALKPGRRLYFDKKELIQWIKSSRKLSNEEIAIQADKLLKRGRIPYQRKRKATRSF